MKTISKNYYICEICKIEYSDEQEAKECESKPISQDKGVKVGDIVNIIKGEGQGKGKVTNIFIIDKNWGQHVYERYWHTVGLSADCVGSWGSRQLTFDDYNV